MKGIKNFDMIYSKSVLLRKPTISYEVRYITDYSCIYFQSINYQDGNSRQRMKVDHNGANARYSRRAPGPPSYIDNLSSSDSAKHSGSERLNEWITKRNKRLKFDRFIYFI